jgi:hypothetical protein
MKKRKRVSKHVANAQAAAADTDADTTTTATASKAPKTKTSASARHKDPSEGYHYLNAWSLQQPDWHFNKNMQSWLLRHMYEADKVNKTSFTILVDYLQKLRGATARKRVLEEATARAQRYRAYEATTQASETKKEDAGGEKDAPPKDPAATTKTTTPTDEEENYGLERWKALADHDKRKEYKRAFRVLEALTGQDAVTAA